VVEEDQTLPPPEDVEAASFPFSVLHFSNDDSERNLEDDEKDATTETLEDSSRLE
jgi:hypothetical protein